MEEESEEVKLFQVWNCFTSSPGSVRLTKRAEVPGGKTYHGPWKMGEKRIDGAYRSEVGDSEEPDAILEYREDNGVEGSLLSEGM